MAHVGPAWAGDRRWPGRRRPRPAAGAADGHRRGHPVRAPRAVNLDPPPPIVSAGDGVKVATFLGDETRRLYGLGPPPKRLNLIWKTHHRQRHDLAASARARTSRGRAPAGPASRRSCATRASSTCSAGGFDHNLHKIELATGKVVWEYAFDDIIKSSPTVIENPQPASARRQVPRAGRLAARLSVRLHRPGLAPYRAVSFGTGKELWRLPVPLTASYSRDVDGSGFFLNGRMYSGVESGWFYKLDPFTTTRLERLPRRRRSSPSGCCSATPATPPPTAATSCSRRRRPCSATPSTSAPAPATSTACAAATSRSSGTTAPAPTSTARRCPPRSASSSSPSRSSTSAGHGGVLMLDPAKSPAERRRLVLPHRRPQRWATGRAA